MGRLRSSEAGRIVGPLPTRPPASHRRLVRRARPARRALPGEGAGALVAAAAEVGAERLVREDALERGGERRVVAGIYEEGGVARDLGKGGGLRARP